MGSKTSSQQNQNSTTVADPTAYRDYSQTINRAKQVSSTPYQAYTGPLTAGINNQEQTATNALNGLGAAANGYYGAAAQQSGLGAAAVNPSAVDANAISQYSSPYQQQVINATEAQLNQQDAIQQQQLTSGAIGAGAYGGDRAGVAAAALAGQQDLANNSTIAGLNNQNYAQALGEANTQQSVGLGAAQANRAAIQQNASTLAGIGSASTASGLGVAGAQLGAGELQQQTQQAADTAAYGQFEQAQAYPFQTEQYLANIVGSLAPNYGSSSAGTTTTQTSGLNSILGLGLGAAALAPGASTIGSGISSLGTGLGNFFNLSDRRAKEGLEKVGALFDGQPIYKFRYRGHPETHLGLVAQEVEKKHPGAVGTLGDVKMVDYDAATRPAADKGHFAYGGGVGPAHLHRIDPGEVAHLERASGGSTIAPYSDAVGYVPATGIGAPAHMLTSPLPSPSQPTNPIPNFTQFAQAGQGLGSIATGAGNAAGTLGQAASFLSTPKVIGGLATGGKVVGLDAARMKRRGYDGGGVVGSDAMIFDPNAVDYPQAMQAGVGYVAPAGLASAALPVQGIAPPPPQGLGAATTPPASAPQGLAAAQMPAPAVSTPPANDNPPVPVAPAPNVTPIVGYRQADGTVSPPPAGLGAAAATPTGLGAAAAPSAGLGAAAAATTAPDAISAATAPRSVRNNNPGNIVDGSFAQKMPGYAGTDGRFAIFDSPQNGAAAQDTLLNNYGQQGLVTPMQIVSKWAPAGDGSNNPAAYAGAVAKTLGIGVNDPIDMTNPTARASLAQAMAKVEAGSGSVPASAMGYTGGGLGPAALPSSPSTGDLGSVTPSILKGLSAADTSTPKPGGLAGYLGFGQGGNGGLLGLSDDSRMALLSAAAGIMASPSKSPGIAIGQGIQQGIGAYQGQQKLGLERATAQGQVANIGSEIQNRTALQGIDKDKVTLAGQQLAAKLQEIRQQGGNYQSEDAYRKALVGNEATRVALERYQLFPGPDGSFRYLDRANPGRGLLTAAQVPELAAAAGSPSNAGGGGIAPVTGSGASPASGGAVSTSPPPSLNGPSALKSDDFMKTGRPTLAAPQGYLPTNWWNNSIRMQGDPVAREAAAAQTKEDVTNSAVGAQKANTALYYSDEMDRNMDTLSKSGLLQPGAAFPERLNLAKSYNLAAGVLNLPKVDENATTAGQSLVKDQTRLASQLTSSLGSREAASVFASMMAATPGPSNTTGGYKGISSSIRVLAQRDIDRNAFMQNYQSRYGSTGEADVAFNALNPPMNYARQAQALARIPQSATDLLRANANDPRAIAGFERVYGPGTSRYFTGAQ